MVPFFFSVEVFPVHTGVFLKMKYSTVRLVSLPRAYGGVSKDSSIIYGELQSSPCIRGCFRCRVVVGGSRFVFPVHTGVFLRGGFASIWAICLPRAYGGVSFALLHSAV